MTAELALVKPQVEYGRDARLEAEHLVESQRVFTTSFHEARSLGREMLIKLNEMDAARKELEKQGIFTSIELQPELQAAYRSVRRLIGDGSELDVPTFLRS